MKSRILAMLISTAVMTLMLTACASEIPEPVLTEAPIVTDVPPVRPDYPISFENEVFDKAPESVVSLSPALTEILLTVDSNSEINLIGVSTYCDYPESVERIETAGTPANPDIDRIIELAPELLITQSPIASTDALKLKRAGVRVVEFDQPDSYAAMCDLYMSLLKIFFGNNRAENMYSSLTADWDAAISSVASSGMFKQFVIVESETPDGYVLAPEGTFENDLFSLFGANLWAGSGLYVAPQEALESMQPEVVFYSNELSKSDLKDIFGRDCVYVEVDIERLERPTARAIGLLSGYAAAIEE